jgi:ATP-dependent DNA helicase RecG
MAQEAHVTGARPTGGPHPLIERAIRILRHEQRTGHADSAVKPGGLESFVARWVEDVRAARGRGELGERPFEETVRQQVGGYAGLDPMQRAARVRSALAALESVGGMSTHPGGAPTPQQRPATQRPTSVRKPPVFGAKTRPQAAPAREEPWPLATPPPKPPVLSSQRPAQRAEPLTPRPEDEYLLKAPVTAIPGVGATQAERLGKLGVETVRDLLYTFPREHRDYSKLQKIRDLPFNEVSTVLGLIWEVETKRTSGGRTRTVARISDETGAIRVSWFNQPYLQKQLPRGSYIVVTGVKQRFGNAVEFSAKSHELPEQGDLINTGRLVPVYPLTEGLHPKAMRRFTKWAVDHCAPFVPDVTPGSIRAHARLMTAPEAIAQIHYPDNERALAAARRRLAFDELFLIQLGMLTRRANFRDGPEAVPLPVPESLIFADAPQDESAPNAALEGQGLWPLTASCFEAALPFRFTGAQRRAIREILTDLRASRPMCRLLQGDVGSGKTVVAAAALLAAAANGYQGALLAPTEILAEQHYRGLSALLAPFGLKVVLLTGSQKAKERNAARTALANGEATVAIGTHALIQEGIEFKRLGLAVVDEQHRFGVEQRDALRQKGHNPHMLVMTATPIPRTLALTLYGDLDVSTLDEAPAGRLPIITRWRRSRRSRSSNGSRATCSPTCVWGWRMGSCARRRKSA